MNFHNGHKLLLIDDEESLKKENITLDDYTKEFDNNIQKLDKLKALIEEEMIKIDNAYESVDKEVTKSYEIKKEKLNEEENELKETLKIEVTKIKEKFEICLSEINNLSKISDKILKGVKNLENEEKNMNKTLSYISKINKSQKEMKRLFQELMKNIKISYIENEGKIKYDEYYFSGIPIPEKIKFEFDEMNNLKVFWNMENIKILNIDHKEIKYRIEIRKEGEKFNQINIDNKTSYLINNLEKNSNYEIRICSVYKDLFSNWSKLYKINTFIDSKILLQSEIGNEHSNKSHERSGNKNFESIYRGTRDGSVKGLFDLNNNKSESKGFSLFNNEKKNENENEKNPIFDDESKSIFGNMILKDTTEPMMGNMEEGKKKDSKQEDFFGNSNANLVNSKQKMNSLFKGDNNNSIFNTEPRNERGGLFNQNNQVSKAINQQSLFNFNNPDNQNTLLGKVNPFLNSNSKSKNQSTTSLFGNENQNKDKNNTPNLSFLGNISGGNNSLFGAPKTGNKFFS